MFLLAVIGLTVGLTMGRGPFGRRLRDARKSILAADATSPALPNRPGETTSSTSTLPAANTFDTPAVNPPSPETEESAQKAHPINPSMHDPRIQLPARHRQDHLQQSRAAPRWIPITPRVPKNYPPPSLAAAGNPAPGSVTPATRTALHPSSRSAILVSGPSEGSKPFRLNLPEKPIAASSSSRLPRNFPFWSLPLPALDSTRSVASW